MNFQGKPVGQVKVQLTGGGKDLFDDVKLEIDQILSFRVDGRVTGVDHRVDEKTGDLIQVVRVKALEFGEFDVLSTPGGSVMSIRQVS